MKFIDCNCSFGIRRNILPFSITEKEDVKKELKRLNVVKAITTHSTQKEFDLSYGNVRLSEEIKNDDFFIGSMCLMPLSTKEYLDLNAIDNFVDKNKIKTFILYPNAHRYSFKTWNMKEIYDYISKKELPVIISQSEIPMDSLYEILKENAKMKVIYTDIGYANDRTLMTLLKEFNNLYVETSGYQTLDGIEYISQNFGAERLLFGTGMPMKSPGAAVSRILFSKISDSEKEKIAYRNICNLIGEVL